MRNAARGVERSAASRFSAAPGGAMRFSEDSGYPSLRGVPAMPDGKLEPGDAWTAPGERSVEVEGTAAPILLPFLAEYRFLGPAEYRGRAALKLGAKFATRYRASGGSDMLAGATGSHELEILIDSENGAPLFIRDRFDESFSLARGGSLRRSGFSLLFYDGSAPLDRGAAVLALRSAAAPGGTAPDRAGSESASPRAAVSSETLRPEGGAAGDEASAAPPGAGAGPLVAGGDTALDESVVAGATEGALGAAGVELGESSAGIVLRVRDLRFVADSDRILESELWRLDAIAAALAVVPGRRFLVEGHSAAVGKASGELELSERRAARVAAELVARGIGPSLLMYRGLGSSRPVAPNDSEEGRAMNRRVEITILDY